MIKQKVFILNTMDIENKQLLGEMMDLMITENGIKNNKKKEVMIFLNERCSYHWERKPSYYNINDINKNILNECYNYIRKSKDNGVREDIPRNKLIPEYTGIKEKNDDFDTMYNAYKDDFKRVSEGNKPKEIDFSATSDDFPNSKNVDVLLSQTLEDRSKELEDMQKHYNKDKEEAERWLSNEKVENIPINKNIGPPKLVIHEREEKKVRFAISPETTSRISQETASQISQETASQISQEPTSQISPNIDSIIGRMKTKESSEEMKEVINILKEILTTQKEIASVVKHAAREGLN